MSNEQSFHVVATVAKVETPEGKADKRKITINTSRGERTLWSFLNDRDGNVHPWMEGVAMAAINGRHVVFHGFMAQGSKVNEKSGKKPTFYNVTKAEPFDATNDDHVELPNELPLFNTVTPDPTPESPPADDWGSPPVGGYSTGGNAPAATVVNNAPSMDPATAAAWCAVETIMAAHGATLLPAPPDDSRGHLDYVIDRAVKLSRIVGKVADAIRGEAQ